MSGFVAVMIKGGDIIDARRCKYVVGDDDLTVKVSETRGDETAS